MIDFDISHFFDSGFSQLESLDEKNCMLEYSGKILKYQIFINNEADTVSISADTELPFSSESLYEICVPCKNIVFKSSNDIPYRKFHFSFHSSSDTTNETTLALTVAGRLSDGELAVWPYFKKTHDTNDERNWK